MDSLPQIGQPFEDRHIAFLKAFTKSCRYSIVEMTTNAQSGHPGGSLSSIDYLSVLYAFVVGQTGEPVVISNGHISPAVYSVLAEMGYIPREDVVKTFRKIGSIYEGHVTRHVPGVWYGTGPLGIGVSAATGFAIGEKLRASGKKVFGLVGDGESQEGQVYEMMNFAAHHKLDNFILFVDYNKVQLSDSLAEIGDTNIAGHFRSAGWEIIDVDAHDYASLWEALGKAYGISGKPVLIIGNSIMGKGVPGMEEDGSVYKATWHGKAADKDSARTMLEKIAPNREEKKLVVDFRSRHVQWKPTHPNFSKNLSAVKIDVGNAIVYKADELTDCRTAYGKALFDLTKRNRNILALTADLRASVMTKFVYEGLPEQHIECGIAEQHMVSCSGGLSLDGYIPFCSTFGAFMTSRAKDQARVNDINRTNVKMVATHCGLSVGEDGPTHQAIDDMGSFLGLLNTMIIEPADPNQTDRIIRYIASHYGNFYVRMGRHKFPVITKENGGVFYDANYAYEYGKCDIIREGRDITVAASGAMVTEALKARDMMLSKNPNASIEVVAVSSIKKFDDTLINSIRKTKKVITAEDHNSVSGLGGMLAAYLEKNGILTDAFHTVGVREYQLSGTWSELYDAAEISARHICAIIESVYV